MPLVALIIGTAALGSEIEDGTAVYLMIKPIPRWRIALAKIIVAAGLDRGDGRPGCPPDRLLLLGSAAATRSTTIVGFAVAACSAGAPTPSAFVDPQRCSPRGRCCSVSPTS